MRLRLLLLAATAHLAARPAAASPTAGVAVSSEPAASAPRTLREVVDLALKDGREDSLDEATSRSLGLGEAEIPLRLLSQERGETKHTFGVLFVDKEAGPEPKGVVLIISVSSAGVVERQGFRQTLDGQLRGALTASGPAKKLKVSRMPLPSAQDAWRRELDFWLAPPEPAKP